MQLFYRLGLTGLVILFYSGDAICQEKAPQLTQAEITARDYAYKSASIGTPLPEFEADFNPGFPSEIKTDEGKVTYTHEISNQKVILFTFTHGRLTSIQWTLVVSPSMTNKAEKKVIAMFGRPHRTLPNDLYAWEFPNVDRRVGYVQHDNTMTIFVLDTTPLDATGEPANQDLDFGF